jgi:hypothetical protein
VASSSQVESIFSAALEKKAGAERSAYLDQACGGDAALRIRVEKLLDSHPLAMGFLAQPAIDRRRFNTHNVPEDLTSHGPTSDSESSPRDLTQAIGMAETQSDERRENVERMLSFLQPSKEPGSLGRLAHYDIQEVLGGGGFGIVVKALDLKLHRLVAIKLMSPLLAVTSAPRKRFVREARATAAIRHENVIAIYAVEDQPIPYLVMEYIAGRTLQQKVEASGPLELLDLIKLGRQIAAGLAAAHGMGLIHRDIKPANILLEDGALHVKSPISAWPARPMTSASRSRKSSPARRCTWRPSRHLARPPTSGPICSAWAVCSTRCAAAGRRSGPRTRSPCSSASSKTRPARSRRSTRRFPSGSAS